MSPPRRLVEQPLEDGQEERGRLPGAGLSGADDVPAQDRVRDGVPLDRRGRGVPDLLYASTQFRVERKVLEGPVPHMGGLRRDRSWVGHWLLWMSGQTRRTIREPLGGVPRVGEPHRTSPSPDR